MTATTIERPSLGVRRRWTILAICALSLFLVGLDTTIVNVALPEIGRGLGVRTRGLEWIVDAYTLVFASLLITAGALADRFGRRRVFRIGLVVFAASSAACAVAPSTAALVTARALQGVGASMLSPVALAIVVNAITDPRERARAIGVWASVFGLSMAAGPVTGGALVAAFGWRSVFWVSVPVALLALVLATAFVPESRAGVRRPLDVLGQVLLVVAVAAVVGGLIEGPHVGWGSAALLAAAAVAVVTIVAFVRVEARRPAPLMDLALFRMRAFTRAVLGAVVVFAALTTALLLNTLYLQHARGWTPVAAGAATLPMALGATVCAPLSGALVGRSGTRLPLLLAGASLSVGGAALVRLGPHTDVRLLLVAYLLVGIGFGFANAPITTTAVSGLPPERAGVAGAITSTARQVGSALGIAIAGGLVAGAPASSLGQASRPGWMLVAACGVFVMTSARQATRRRASPPARCRRAQPPSWRRRFFG